METTNNLLLSGVFLLDIKKVRDSFKSGSIVKLNLYRLHIETVNIIEFGNARMMTFQSLLHKLNLKQLISTLNKTHQKSPLPFYVLKLTDQYP